MLVVYSVWIVKPTYHLQMNFVVWLRQKHTSICLTQMMWRMWLRR